METGDFQQAIRTATVTYPIPFLVGTLLLFALLCFGAGIATGQAFGWVMVAVGIGATAFAFAVTAYAIVKKPDLLRSESHVQMMTVINMIGDNEMNATQRQQVGLALVDVLGERRPKGFVAPLGSRKENSDG